MGSRYTFNVFHNGKEDPAMLDNFEETYAEYKRLFAKIDEADSISGKNELFRQLTALLSKMEHGIDGSGKSAKSTAHVRESAPLM